MLNVSKKEEWVKKIMQYKGEIEKLRAILAEKETDYLTLQKSISANIIP